MHLKQDCPYAAQDRATPANIVSGLAEEAPEFQGRQSVGLLGSGVYITCSIDGYESEVLIDSGAQVSMVHESIWRDVTQGKRDTLAPYHGTLRVANGQCLNILGLRSAVVNIDGLQLCWDFVLASDSDHGALICTYFLVKYGAVVDMKKRTLTVIGKVVPLILRGWAGGVFRVTVDSDTVIPARSEIVITGKVDGALSYEKPEVF